MQSYCVGKCGFSVYCFTFSFNMAAPDIRVVVVQGITDLLPDSYSGDNNEVDIEEFFTKYRQWLQVHMKDLQVMLVG